MWTVRCLSNVSLIILYQLGKWFLFNTKVSCDIRVCPLLFMNPCILYYRYEKIFKKLIQFFFYKHTQTNKKYKEEEDKLWESKPFCQRSSIPWGFINDSPTHVIYSVKRYSLVSLNATCLKKQTQNIRLAKPITQYTHYNIMPYTHNAAIHRHNRVF